MESRVFIFKSLQQDLLNIFFPSGEIDVWEPVKENKSFAKAAMYGPYKGVSNYLVVVVRLL